MNKKLQPIERLIKTIVFDNGKEFSNHKDLLPKSTAKVYFCDADSPWQKPLIEKVNSMIHRIYPKTADIKLLTKSQLQAIENKLSLLNQLCKFSHKHLKFYPQILSKNEPWLHSNFGWA
jgi:IS30 family transposase